MSVSGLRSFDAGDGVARTTVVFDIDGTLCGATREETYRSKFLIKTLYDVHYVMFPHFKDLLELLLQENCTVAFFSLGSEDRNIPLIENYLSDNQILGVARYNQLKAEGQFEVYSHHHCRLGESFVNYKPLKQILKNGQTIDNIMLIDDYARNAGPHEQPLILIPENLSFNAIMYYLIGFFLDFFKAVADSGVSIREYVVSKTMFFRSEDHLPALVLQGLNEVRKTTPEAVFYYHDGQNPAYCMLKMKEVVPSIESIEGILSRSDTMNAEGVDSGTITTFKRYLQDYFVPYYRDTLSDEEKQRLPERVKKLMVLESESRKRKCENDQD